MQNTQDTFCAAKHLFHKRNAMHTKFNLSSRRSRQLPFYIRFKSLDFPAEFAMKSLTTGERCISTVNFVHR